MVVDLAVGAFTGLHFSAGGTYWWKVAPSELWGVLHFADKRMASPLYKKQRIRLRDKISNDDRLDIETCSSDLLSPHIIPGAVRIPCSELKAFPFNISPREAVNQEAPRPDREATGCTQREESKEDSHVGKGSVPTVSGAGCEAPATSAIPLPEVCPSHGPILCPILLVGHLCFPSFSCHLSTCRPSNLYTLSAWLAILNFRTLTYQCLLYM